MLLLAEHFLDKYRAEFHKPGLELSEEARRRLGSHSWPGNVRELQNTMERAAILCDGHVIEAAALHLLEPRPAAGEVPTAMLPEGFRWEGSLKEISERAVEAIERFKIESTLRECKWNKTRAAERLGVSYKTLLNKIRALGLES